MSTPAAPIASPNATKNRDQLSRYENVSVQGEVIATDTGTTTLVANANTKRQLFVRKVIINVYTSAAQAFQFESNGSGADPFANFPASPGVGPRTVDWGELGYALPAGEGVAIALGVTGGNAFTYVIEMYRKNVGVLTPSQI